MGVRTSHLWFGKRANHFTIKDPGDQKKEPCIEEIPKSTAKETQYPLQARVEQENKAQAERLGKRMEEAPKKKIDEEARKIAKANVAHGKAVDDIIDLTDFEIHPHQVGTSTHHLLTLAPQERV